MPANFAISVTIKALDQVTQTINRVTSNVSRQSSALKQFNANMERMAGSRRFSSAVSDLSGEVGGVFKSLEAKRFFADVKTGAQSAVGSVKQLGDALKQSVAVLGGAGLALGGLGFASNKLFSDVSRSSLDLKQTSEKLNVQPSLLRAYRFGGESVGVPRSQIDAALGRLNQMGFDLRAGNPAAAEPLSAFTPLGGVKLLDDRMKQRSPVELLGEIADKINTKGLSQVTKVEIISKVFGSADILPFLSLGSGGIKNLTNRFDHPIDPAFEKTLANYLKATTRLNEALDQLKINFGVEAFPGLASGLEKISAWISDHGKELRQLFSDLGESIPQEMESAIHLMDLFVRALTFVSKHVGIANLAFIAFSVSIVGKLFNALSLLIPSLETFNLLGRGTAMAWGGLRAVIAVIGATLASPITWVVVAVGVLTAALGGLAYITYKNWDQIKAGFLKFKNDLISGVSEIVSEISQALENGYQAVLEFFSFSQKPQPITQPIDSSWLTKNSSGKNDWLESLLQSKSQKEAKSSAEVTVKFENLPQGVRVSEAKGNAKINLFAGYSLVGEVA